MVLVYYRVDDYKNIIKPFLHFIAKLAFLYISKPQIEIYADRQKSTITAAKKRFRDANPSAHQLK